MDAEGYLSEVSRWIAPALERQLEQLAASPESLRRAMAHLIFPGGKRLRPALVCAACEAAGGERESATPAALAVELIHTYSLVHDDLPCMDDDATRRGRPTVHVAYGEAVAVLAGDALQALAFEALAQCAPGMVGPATRELASAAGARALVGGQVDDLSFPRERPDLHRVESVHRRKTAALLAASTSLGARCADAPERDREALAAFGEAVGLAFQIVDDCHDGGRDEACSILRVLSEEEARARADALLEEALAGVERFGAAAGPLRELGRFAVRRKR